MAYYVLAHKILFQVFEIPMTYLIRHMQLQHKSEINCFYSVQFNASYHLVLGYCTCVMQSFKNKYYVTDEDILNLQVQFNVLVLGS